MAIQFGTSCCRAVVANDSGVARVRSQGYALGLWAAGVTDGFGLFNGSGSPISPNQLMVLIFDYLVESRKGTGGATPSVAISNLVDRVAEAGSLAVYEMPEGFKYIGETINEDKIVISGKESADLSIKDHDPKKDGILARLPATKAVASCGACLASS